MLDRHRFEEAHLRFAVLRIASHYLGGFSSTDFRIDQDLKNTLVRVTPIFYSLLRACYTGKLTNSYMKSVVYNFYAMIYILLNGQTFNITGYWMSLCSI